MPTLYSMVNETGNRNWILEMCRFRIRFRLVHRGMIVSVTRYGFHQILHVIDSASDVLETINRKYGRYPILEVCRFRFRQFSGSVEHVCHRIGTKFRTLYKQLS